MTLQLKEGSNNYFYFPESLSIYDVQALHSELLGIVGDHDLVLDLANTTQFDSAGAQLLVAFIQQQKNRQHGVFVVNAQQEVQEKLALFGCSEILNTAPQDSEVAS